MALKFNTENILHETDIRQVEHDLTRYATELAILGEVDAARELISLLLQKGITGRDTSSLNWAWRETGQWPTGCSANSQSEDTFVEMRKHWEGNHWGETSCMEIPKEFRTFDEKCLEVCLAIPERAMELGHLDATTGWTAIGKSARWTRALEIAIRMSNPFEKQETVEYGEIQREGEVVTTHTSTDPEERAFDEDWVSLPDLDERSSAILEEVVARWDANQQVEYLAMAEDLWPLYISGAVAREMGLSRPEIKAKASAIVEAYSSRLANGFARTPLAGKSIMEVLEIANENTLHGPGKEYWGEAGGEDDGQDDLPSTMFHQPATLEEISALEMKLDVKLPENYKQFLQASNGFGHNDDGIYNGYFPSPALFDTGMVRWVEEDYFQLPIELLELPQEIEQLGDVQERGEFGFDTALPVFDRVLEIGVRDIDNVWLVRPELVRQAKDAYKTMYKRANKKQKRTIDRAIEAFAGSKEEFNRLKWCCVTWASGGYATMASYMSFARYLEVVTASSMEKIS